MWNIWSHQLAPKTNCYWRFYRNASDLVRKMHFLQWFIKCLFRYNRDLDKAELPVYSVQGHESIINAIDGVGGLGIGGGAPEIVTGSRDGNVKKWTNGMDAWLMKWTNGYNGMDKWL